MTDKRMISQLTELAKRLDVPVKAVSLTFRLDREGFWVWACSAEVVYRPAGGRVDRRCSLDGQGATQVEAIADLENFRAKLDPRRTA